jgi:hypothetical protein
VLDHRAKLARSARIGSGPILACRAFGRAGTPCLRS